MEKNGVHKHPAIGHYYTGYGDSLFTWEVFLDTIALLHAGDASLGKNAVRIKLSLQHDDGFIPRHWEGFHTGSGGGGCMANL